MYATLDDLECALFERYCFSLDSPAVLTHDLPTQQTSMDQ